MSKKILFLYFSPGHKAELSECETVFKAIFRKFRKSVLFSYLQTDSSLSCRELVKKALFNEFNRCDAVLFNGDKEACVEEEEFSKDALGLFATEQHIKGRVICFPAASLTAAYENGCITETQTTYRSSLQKAAELSVSLAKRRRHKLTICTQAESRADNLLLREVEYALGSEPHIRAEHIAFDEMVSHCMNTIPSFDVVLTTEQSAKIIAMHLRSLQKAPTGYLLRHTENARIYCRQLSPHEEMTAARAASILLAFSALLENELGMKSAADWLRRSVSLAFEQYAAAPKNEFLARVIFEINKPMRNIRGTQNESTD